MKLATDAILYLLFVSQYIPYLHSLDTNTIDSASKGLTRTWHLTGSIYRAALPVNLSGIEVSIVRLRSKRLWNIGAKFNNFQIPPRTKTVPHVKSLAIVYQNFGNWSSHCYNVPGYKMITPVVNFMVFNASNERAKSMDRIRLDTGGKSIVISFADSRVDKGVISEARCVEFVKDGVFRLSDMKGVSVCYSQDHQGHFSVVVPIERKIKKRRLWYLWMVGFVIGFGGLVMVMYLVILLIKMLKSKRIQVMERRADEDLALESVWVGGGKMPAATGTRTQPALEAGAFS